MQHLIDPSRLTCLLLVLATGMTAVGDRREVAAAVIEDAPALSNDAPPSKSTTAGVSRANDGLFYVTAIVNGTPLKFLVDTGASVSVLTERDARLVGAQLDTSSPAPRIGTVGGQISAKWAKLDSLTIANKHMSSVRAVVASNGLEVSLIGQNVLAQFEAMHVVGDKLHLQ